VGALWAFAAAGALHVGWQSIMTPLITWLRSRR